MKLLTFAAIVAFCGADKLDRTYLPPPGAKLSGGSPGSINTPLEKHGPTGSEPDYQKFLTPPVESESSVPFSQKPSQSNPEFNRVPDVRFMQESQTSSTGSRPFSNDMLSISQGGNQRFQDTTRTGSFIPQGSRPGLSDSSSTIRDSSEHIPSSNTNLPIPGSRPSFRDSTSSIPTHQSSNQHFQGRPGRPFSQGSIPSISDLLSTVPISEGIGQRIPEENLPTRPEVSFSQKSRPSLSDSASSVPIVQGSDQSLPNYNDQSRPVSSISQSVFSGPTSQLASQHVTGSNDGVRPELSITKDSRPSLTDSQIINSQLSNGQDSSGRPSGSRYDTLVENGSTSSPIDGQKHPDRLGTNYDRISKPGQSLDVTKNGVSNKYIPSDESYRPSYEGPASQQTTNYQNDNQRRPGSDSTRLPYKDDRGSVPSGAGTQTPLSDTRYQKQSSGSSSAQGDGPFRGTSAGPPISQGSISQFPNKEGDNKFESEAIPSSNDTDVDYDDNDSNSGIDSQDQPDIGKDNAEGGQSTLVKSGPRNQNNRYVENVDRPQAALERTAAIIRYENVINPDGTFAYDFETENGIKAQEHGTSANGVQAEGDFSYVGDDGQVYSITYTADERGYQPQGDHLPTAPPIPDAILKSLEIIAQREAAGELDDGSYDERKYGPGQSDSGNGNYDRSRFDQQSRSDDDLEPRTETELENDLDNDLESIEIKAATPGSNDYDDNTYGNEQNLNQAQRPNYGSKTDYNQSPNEEGNKYFRTGNSPSTNIVRQGITSEQRPFETTPSSNSRRPSSDGLSVSGIRNTESPSSLKLSTSPPHSLVHGNQNHKVNPSTPGFEYTTTLPDFSTPTVRGPQQTLPKTSMNYTPAIAGSLNRDNLSPGNRRPQVAHSPTAVGSQNTDEKYPQEMLPKSSTQYLPAKQGSPLPRNRYQETPPKISPEYTSFIPSKFGSDIRQKQQPQYSIDYTSPQVNPSLSTNGDYQTNSPITSPQYTTQEPIMGERKYQKTLPKSSLMYIPSAPGFAIPGNQEYEVDLPKAPSEDKTIIPGSVQSHVTRYQTPPKAPVSEVRTYQNGLPKPSLKNIASPEDTRKQLGNFQSANDYEEEINKSPNNEIVPSSNGTKPERIHELNNSNNRGPSKFNRPEYGSTTTQQQPLFDETKDQKGTRYSQESNRQPISKLEYQSPNTQNLRVTTLRPSQYQTTSDVTLKNIKDTTQLPYVPNNFEKVITTNGPYRAITTLMPEKNQESKTEDNYNIQPNIYTEGDFGHRIESRPQSNISFKHTMQTSSPYINNEDGYNYQVPKTQFNYNKFSPSSQHIAEPETGHSQTNNPTEEDYVTTIGNRNVYSTTISPGLIQRNKYPSVTTITPQSSTTFRNNVNRYNQVPKSEEPSYTGTDGNGNLQSSYIRDNKHNQPFSQQPSSQYNPIDRNLDGRPQNLNTRPKPEQYSRFPPQSDSQDQGVQDDGKQSELQGEHILADPLDSLSQRPFGRPQSNTNNVYPQNGGDNARLRPTPFVKEFPASNTFVGAEEKFPGSRRPPSYSSETGYKY